MADVNQHNALHTNPTKAQVKLAHCMQASIVLKTTLIVQPECCQFCILCNLQGDQYKSRTGINSREDYESMYQQSLTDPAAFWGKFAEEYHWQQKVFCVTLLRTTRGSKSFPFS